MAKTTKRGVGQPRLYTPEALQAAIDKYFEPFGDTLYREHKGEMRVPTISGLSYHLGTDRTTFYLWAHEKGGEYFNIAKAALARLSSYWEEYAATGKSPSGAAFWLRNHGWTADTKSTTVDAQADKDGTMKVVVTVTGGDGTLDV